MPPDEAIQARDLGDESSPTAEVEGKVPIGIGIRLSNDRPEYRDKARRVVSALGQRLDTDEELRKAFKYLAIETSFVLIIATPQRRRILLPGDK